MKQSVVKYFVALLFFAGLILLSCSKAYNPKEDTSIPLVIRALISEGSDCLCEPYINEYKWRNQTVYLSSCRGPMCDCMALYYNAAGQSITMPAGYFLENFRLEAELLREIWRCNQ